MTKARDYCRVHCHCSRLLAYEHSYQPRHPITANPPAPVPALSRHVQSSIEWRHQKRVLYTSVKQIGIYLFIQVGLFEKLVALIWLRRKERATRELHHHVNITCGSHCKQVYAVSRKLRLVCPTPAELPLAFGPTQATNAERLSPMLC